MVVSELVLKEVEKVLLACGTRNGRYGCSFHSKLCVVIPRKETMGTDEQLARTNKEKDLENLAAVKQFHISHLISHDRIMKTFTNIERPNNL